MMKLRDKQTGRHYTKDHGWSTSIEAMTFSSEDAAWAFARDTFVTYRHGPERLMTETELRETMEVTQ